MRKATIYDRIIETLKNPDPPKTFQKLVDQLGAKPSTARLYIDKAIARHDLDPFEVPWSKTAVHNRLAQREAAGQPQLAGYRTEIDALRAENTKLREAQGLVVHEEENPLLKSLVRILQAAGRELTAEASEKAFPPSAILSASEAMNEEADSQILAGSPAS